MKIKFESKGLSQPYYEIIDKKINGIDLSEFPDGGVFVGDESTLSAGIYCVTRVDGVIYVTLAQQCCAYQCQPKNGSHDWAESGWINAADYNPDTCYIIATSAPDGAEYHRTDDGWTVKIPEQEASNELV